MTPTEGRRLLVAAVVAYGAVLALLVLGPWGWALNRFTVRLYVLFRTDVPIAPDGALPEHYGLLLNVLLFVPLGALGVALSRWSWWRVTGLAALASTAIELVQWGWLEREATWQDIAANAVGALVGSVAVTLLARDRG